MITFETPAALAGWERRVQVTWIAPLDPELAEVAERVQLPPPRANLVASALPSQIASAGQAAREFLEQTAKAVPGLAVIEDQAITFADGTPGHRLTVEFNATPDVRLRQTHLFRLDSGFLTQLVSTVDEATGEGEEALLAVALAMRPSLAAGSIGAEARD